MAKQYVISAVIRAKDEASSVIAGVRAKLGTLGSTLSGGFATAATVAAAGFAALTAGVVKATQAAIESEDVNKRLLNALAPLGAAAAGTAQRLGEQADALQQVTRFGDEAIVSGQALLASVTQNEEQLKRSTVAATDLAAAYGIDLNSAFRSLLKASQGSAGGLGRLGIKINEAALKAGGLDVALAAIEARVGGRAIADAKTFSGVIAVLGNSFGELEEKVGGAVTSNDAIKGGLAELNKVLRSDGLTENVTVLAGAVVSLSVALIKGVSAVVGWAKGLGEAIASAGLAIGLFDKEVVPATARSRELAKAFRESADGIEQYQKNAEHAAQATADAAAAAAAAAPAFGAVGGAVDTAAEAMKKLDAAAKALGETTSIQLVAQVEEIGAALIVQREALGATSEEYIRLEAIGRVKIDSLIARIISLRDGLGDVVPAADESAAAIETVAIAAESGATNLDEMAASGDVAVASLNRTTEAARLTSQQFDALAAAAGRAAAVQAALAGGAELSQGGTRVRLGGFSDGSRLTSTPGGATNVGRFTGFPVGVVDSTVSRYMVTPSGRVVPI